MTVFHRGIPEYWRLPPFVDMLPSSRTQGFPSLLRLRPSQPLLLISPTSNPRFPQRTSRTDSPRAPRAVLGLPTHALFIIPYSSAFVALVGFFPHLINLNIRYRFGWTICPFLNVQLSRPLRGKSVIKPFRGDGMKSFFLCSPNSSRSTRNLYLRLSPCRFSCGEPHISQNIPM